MYLYAYICTYMYIGICVCLACLCYVFGMSCLVSFWYLSGMSFWYVLLVSFLYSFGRYVLGTSLVRSRYAFGTLFVFLWYVFSMSLLCPVWWSESRRFEVVSERYTCVYIWKKKGAPSLSTELRRPNEVLWSPDEDSMLVLRIAKTEATFSQ